MSDPFFEPNHEPEKRDTDHRTPIVLAIVAGVLLIAVVIALVAFLSRPGDPTSDPEPTQPSTPATPSTSVTPMPAETTPASEGTEVEVSGEGFTITDDAGTVVFTHGWADAADPAVAALTEAFGEAPTEDFQNGDADNWAYTIYVWDDFRLYDVFLSAGNRPREEIPAPTYLSFSDERVGDATIVDEFGVEPGMPVDEVRALGPDSEAAASGGGIRFVFGADRGTFWSDGVRDFSALAATDASGARVATVTYTFYDGS